MKTSSSFDQQPTRRSRWEPTQNIWEHFATMDDIESQTSSTDSRSSPTFAVQTGTKNVASTILDYDVLENDELCMASMALEVSPRTQQLKKREKSNLIEPIDAQASSNLLDTSNSSRSDNLFSFGKYQIQNELTEQAIKLDCDMENSIRRQSISAR